jgi:S1-C subfamily serine protease
MPCFNAHAQDETPAQILQYVQSSLVEVRTVDTKTIDEGNGHTKVGTYHTQGSGVIIDSHGVIATNTHIIANAPHIYVGLSDGTVLEASLIYSSDADFSFIKIDPPYPLQVITWADSSQAPAGTPIIGLSYADDIRHILSGQITNLVNGADSNNVELIELNLGLIPGDSGGPLLDNQGHLLGMIMAKRLSEDNKTYAIASNKIQQEYERYKNKGDNELLL